MAEDGYMHVQFESLTQLFDDLGRIHDAGVTTVENLQTALSTNLALWSSDAREFYNQKQASWNNLFTSMSAQLAAARAHVNNANDLYLTAENRNVGIWG